jgi:energy-coupling factor transporter ATP-binding protein EcfA2
MITAMPDPNALTASPSSPVASLAATPSPAAWPYPGARWWKFDFHAHTPASLDTRAWQQAIGTDQDVTPERWLSQFMAAGIDCVAITDHNTGAWIDRLKQAYQRMEQVDAPGFRPLVLFPGVEISVQGGFHLLALFDPSRSSADVERLLGAAGYVGTPGDSDGVTSKGLLDTIVSVHDAGAIPIPAHADRRGSSGKALFAVREGSQVSLVDANTLKQLFEAGNLLAVEWENLDHSFPACIREQAANLTKVLGSESHSFQGARTPGSRFTWVKMASPTIKGLRLALLDGNGGAMERWGGDEAHGRARLGPPSVPPALVLREVRLSDARCMGQGTAATLRLNPWFNAIIGGRGSGKSTWVHALRLVLQRTGELERLGPNSEAWRQFDSFNQVSGARGQSAGGLRLDTLIELELERDGVHHRLRWQQPDLVQGGVEEQIPGGEWQPSASQAITAERFPIQIFSQGQIAALADQGRSTLLELIDQGARLAPQSRRIEELRRTYLSQRARLRELEGRLAERAERERELSELRRKLAELAELDPGTVLADQQRAVRQRRELDRARQHLEHLPVGLEQVAAELPLDDWSAELFDPERDADALAWRQEIDALLLAANTQLQQLAAALGRYGREQSQHPGFIAWRTRADAVERAAQQLQAELADRGLADPGLMGHWLQERHRLEALLQELDGEAQEHQALDEANQRQWLTLLDAHQQRSTSRQDFLDGVLQTNDYVRMEVRAFGHDPELFKTELRQLLDLDGNGFESDLNVLVDVISAGHDRLEAMAAVKTNLLNEQAVPSSGGKFRKNLDRKLEQPGFADAIRCWVPADDLQITYSHRGNGRDWTPIQQGSQGQRASALLAFLLSFGDGPLVLDQPEDDLDNKLISELVVAQIRANKMRRQLLIVTHNPNVVVNGDAELVTVMDYGSGQCYVRGYGALQENDIQEEVCAVMEGGREALARRWARLGREL